MVQKFLWILLATQVAVFLSCSGPRQRLIRPGAGPLTSPLPDILRSEPSPAAAAEVPDSGETLALPQALQLALLRNPVLRVFSYEVRIREARTLQAALRPNPEMELEGENLAGTRSYRGTGNSEFTLQIGQLIELSGKREKRKRVAKLESLLAEWDYEAKRLDIYLEVARAFVRTLAAQKQVELAREWVELAENFVANIRARVQAGKDSPAELARAQVERSAAQINLQKAQKELLTARLSLAATWGADTLRFAKLQGNLEQTAALPPLKTLHKFLAQNPDIARWATEQALGEARFQAERARRIPDPTVAGGIRRFQEDGSSALLLGASIPLPLFDRNQGNVQAALLRKRQLNDRKRAVLLRLRLRLAELYNRLQGVQKELAILRRQSLPDAEKAFGIIREGFLSGRFGFLDVLDAQRTLFEVRSRYLEALAEYHQTFARLERLVGRNVGRLN